MIESLAASHAKGKFATDKIFGASGAAVKAVKEHGKSKVINATIGAILDDKEELVMLPTVEKVWRSLPISEVGNYAPISGLPEFLSAAIDATFADNKPEAYIAAIATAGGSGGIHHVIWNYSEFGDQVLTSDWYWGPYSVLCNDSLRKLTTFTLFDENQNFNLKAFEAKTDELLAKQNNLVIILNSPAHNPTGYSISDNEWDNIFNILKKYNSDKRIILLIDIAYLDYAGEKNESRKFMKKLSDLPENVLAVMTFSMSKGHTMYGQRTGAMIGVSRSKAVIKEFEDINQYTSRATWSNINRGAMRLMATINGDKELLAQYESERNGYYRLIRDRANIFTNEAAQVGLNILPYRAGFFITIPANNPDAVCDALHEDLIFAVPLGKGIRVAICAVPTQKMTGIATKIANRL